MSLLVVFGSLSAAADRPNFLIIMADNCTYNDLPLYGGQNAKTPNIDALAQRGLRFNQAYVASAMCQPCRAELFTGRYPLSNGCSWNHSASRPDTQSLPHMLRPLGYRVGIAGKVHVKPEAAFPFDPVSGFDANCVRDPTQTCDLSGIEQYMSAAEESPFCLVVASWPGHIAEGKRTEALVQYADLAPTLIDLAGGPPSKTFDGSSFAAVLLGDADVHREYAFAMHNNLPEGPRYPIRSITDRKFRYIQNLLPGELYVERHLMGGGRLNNPYWATWVGVNPIGGQSVYDLVKRYMLRPAEQLYVTTSDPYEMDNIADDSEYTEAKERLHLALQTWMQSQADPGAAVDTVKALQAARRGKHLFGQSK